MGAETSIIHAAHEREERTGGAARAAERARWAAVLGIEGRRVPASDAASVWCARGDCTPSVPPAPSAVSAPPHPPLSTAVHGENIWASAEGNKGGRGQGRSSSGRFAQRAGESQGREGRGTGAAEASSASSVL